MSVGLSANGLAARRGGRMVFEGVSFLLHAGEALVVTGPNGAGKSTLIRLCGGLLTPAAGEVALTSAGERPPLALLTEAAALDGERRLSEALRFWAVIDGMPEPDVRVAAALVDVDLVHLTEVPVRLLSTGQRRRAGLARVVASGAFLWLLDEPANGLDAAATARLEALIERHLASGGVAVIATHLPLRLPGAQMLELTA